MQDPNADGHMLSITHTAEACNSNCDGVDDAVDAKSVYCVGTLKVRYHKREDGAMVGEETSIVLSEESAIDDENVSSLKFAFVQLIKKILSNIHIIDQTDSCPDLLKQWILISEK